MKNSVVDTGVCRTLPAFTSSSSVARYSNAAAPKARTNAMVVSATPASVNS
ncbi:MAG: hypothetical protein J07HN4v3_02713 [Halonotius sp. J07HN4]|nr:MAG: hypothetical protein J07HN4v3_02713 [Halonotius sp. J07HN4]